MMENVNAARLSAYIFPLKYIRSISPINNRIIFFIIVFQEINLESRPKKVICYVAVVYYNKRWARLLIYYNFWKKSKIVLDVCTFFLC